MNAWVNQEAGLGSSLNGELLRRVESIADLGWSTLSVVHGDDH